MVRSFLFFLHPFPLLTVFSLILQGPKSYCRGLQTRATRPTRLERPDCTCFPCLFFSSSSATLKRKHVESGADIAQPSRSKLRAHPITLDEDEEDDAPRLLRKRVKRTILSDYESSEEESRVKSSQKGKERAIEQVQAAQEGRHDKDTDSDASDDEDEGARTSIRRTVAELLTQWPRSETEAEAARNQKNASRRQKRFEEAAKYPERAIARRQKSGRQHAQLVLEYWTARTLELAEREVATQEAAAREHASDLAVVQDVVHAFTHHHNHEPIPPEAAVCQWNIHHQSPETCLSTVLSANYFRRIATPAQTGIDVHSQYLCAFPADAPFTVLQLVLLGADLSTVGPLFQAAMTEYGLEGAVAEFLTRIVEDVRIQRLRGTRNTDSKTVSLYCGITHAVSCGSRGWDDLEGNSQVRVLDTPIESSLELRTLPTISQVERILRAILGSSAMNSAEGRVLPILQPPQHLLDLQAKFHSLLPADSNPLGRQRDLSLETRIRHLLDDELNFLTPLQLTAIDPQAFETLKAVAADVIRLNSGFVIKVEMTKDIPHEVFFGVCKGYWAETIGQGPREHRNMLRLLHPEIPADGDMPFAQLAHFFSVCRPLLIASQLNLITAMIRSGDLESVWDGQTPQDVAAVMSGSTPQDLETRLPPDKQCPEFRRAKFTDATGSFEIVRTSANPAHVSIHIGCPHFGRLKYDEVIKRPRWNLNFVAELQIETLVQITAAELRGGQVPDRDDAVEMRVFLQRVKEKSESVLAVAGVTQALTLAKKEARQQEFVVMFLRAMASSKRAHERWLEGGPGEGHSRWDGLKAVPSPSGEEREAQLAVINERAWFLDSLHQDTDPKCLGHWAAPLPSDEFDVYFLGLEDGKDVVRASNAHGRTKEAAESATANQQKIGVWRREHEVKVTVDMDAIMRKNFKEAAVAIAEAETYYVGPLLESWRMAECDRCSKLAVARHNSVYHLCPLNNSKRLLTEENFPALERVLYAHNILGTPQAEAELGDSDAVASELGLVAIPIHDILTPSALRDLKLLLDDDDYEVLRRLEVPQRSVYVPVARCKDNELLLTLAIDILLLNSTHPPQFTPLDPKGRIGLQKKMSITLKEWYDNRSSDLFLIVCAGEPGYTGLPDFIISNKVTKGVKGKSEYMLMGRACGACGGKKGNEGREFHQVRHLFDLPAHFSHAVWMNLRRGIEHSKPRTTQRAKARR
ncbi:hypothetical protein B0H16DRAFT_1709019 [Mycena metata]|uniref:Uncharacterized protein n=1 Tax=Mycena metata TaxID=1033252 RepID=A0AAD7KGL0_9AGAR|nr:hypothetical protein B0H16DRAFT_1709019 [Mycena metata]